MMRTKYFLTLFILITGILFNTTSYAEQDTDDPELGGGFTEPDAWKEGSFVFPPYPQTEDLIKVEVDRVDMPFDFYIDKKNISYSKSEGLIRYTVVIKSSSGANNVLFEGLRCSKREYRTYAYGTYNKGFVKALTSKWAYIDNHGFMAHRYNFFQYYMCNERQTPNAISEIIRKIEYPEDFQGSGDAGD